MGFTHVQLRHKGASHDGWWLLDHSGLSFLFSGFPKLKTHADLLTMVKAGLASWKMAGASVCFMYPLAYTYLCFKFLMSFCFLVGKSGDLILYLGGVCSFTLALGGYTTQHIDLILLSLYLQVLSSLHGQHNLQAS